jgi:hypothetical protein
LLSSDGFAAKLPQVTVTSKWWWLGGGRETKKACRFGKKKGRQALCDSIYDVIRLSNNYKFKAYFKSIYNIMMVKPPLCAILIFGITCQYDNIITKLN